MPAQVDTGNNTLDRILNTASSLYSTVQDARNPRAAVTTGTPAVTTPTVTAPATTSGANWQKYALYGGVGLVVLLVVMLVLKRR